MVRDGLDRDAATRQVWCVDRQGLLTDDMTDLRDFQGPYARPVREVAGWQGHGPIGLKQVVANVKPTILIGTSTAHRAFTEDIVREMARHVDRPVIFPLSNPTERIEAMPDQLIEWTDGRGLIATGIPVSPVTYKGVTYTIGQANNALLYPGLGLGAIAVRAKRISDAMFEAAAQAVAGLVDVSMPGASLLPQVENLRTVSATVAVAVAERAAAEGLARVELTDATQQVQDAMWQPEYRSIKARLVDEMAPQKKTADRGAPTIHDVPIGIDATGVRAETDSLGRVDVPAEHYWGAQTQRSLVHFDIGDDRMPKAVYHAYGYVKKAAAMVNARAGRLPDWKADLITRVADEVIAGKLDSEFPLYVWQTGSGTQSNMNVNEVISNRAIQLTGATRLQDARASQRRRQHEPVLQRHLPHRHAHRRPDRHR
jgi:Malic enzyme, NAD binding domain/Lyase